MADYRPHLPSDKDYLSGVKDTIAERAELEPINFALLNRALESLGITDDPYTDITLNNLDTDRAKSIVAASFTRIEEGGLTSEAVDTIQSLWDYLAEADQLQAAELAFVFGGPGENRVRKAIELYKNGQVKKIMFSGKHASYVPAADETEAEYYRDQAVAAGVPASDIIVETEAKNTPENAANSVVVLNKQGWRPSKIIAITLPYHMRRSWLTLRSAAGWGPKVMRCPIASSKFTRDNFYKDHDGWSYIVNEYFKLYAARLMKHF